MIPVLARTQARLTTYFSDLCFKSLASNIFFFSGEQVPYLNSKDSSFVTVTKTKGHCPSPSYDEALISMKLVFRQIISYCEDICDKVFNAALCNKDNKLDELLTEANKAPYLLRNHQYFELPKRKTDRFKNFFILSSCLIK